MFKLNKDKEVIEEIQQKNIKKRWLVIGLITAVFILLCGIIIIWFQFKYQNKIFYGVKVGDLNLSKLSKEDAFNLINERVDFLITEGLKISYNKKINEKSEIIFLNELINPELFREVISFNIYKTVFNAYSFGRNPNIFYALIEQLNLLISGKVISVNYYLNELLIEQELKNRFSSLEKKELNARPQINCLKDDCQVEILSEVNGLTFDYQVMINNLKTNLSKLSDTPIEIPLKIIYPQIKKDNVLILTEDILDVASTTVNFSYQEKRWSLEKKDIYKMLEFQKNNNNEVVIGIDKDDFISWIKTKISPQIDIPAKNATLEIRNGKIISLNTQQEGIKIDEELIYQELNQKILNKDKLITIDIKIKKIQPDVTIDSINDLGIKEIIGIGKSNFTGSSINRRKNISNGAKMLHGLLIKPDEEFTLINKLLPIDSTNGYLQELVIKGNETVLEYGGGLCQIGTTMFRSALDSGLPILERRNHSYSVSYYLEDGVPGVDATIYDPKPDLIFKNDTGHHILIQSKIEGDNLSFEFWGTNDGRQASRTKPKTWGWKDPLPTKYIETTDLSPGVKKCIENSHKGVTASFDYIITSTDGVVKKQTFTSVYKPWQAVCLIGATIKASSTTEVITTTTESIN